MKTFEFAKKIKQQILRSFNTKQSQCIDDIMALSTIQKCYGNKCKIHVFKTYVDKNVYAYYSDDEAILAFINEKEAYKFILDIGF